MAWLSAARNKVSLALLLAGILAVAISVRADALGLDLTPGFGLVQILGVLAGITLITAASLIFLGRHRSAGMRTSLLADVGLRMGLTGLVACYISGVADMVGVGTHQGYLNLRPFLGPLQLAGLGVGLGITLLGVLLYWLGSPTSGPRDL